MRLGGLDVFVIPQPWRWEFRGPPAKVPSKAQGRWGTKRAWKRRMPKRGWRWVPYEPEHAMRTATAIFVTAKQLRAIKVRAALDG